MLIDTAFWMFNIEYIKVHLKSGNIPGVFKFINALSDISDEYKY
jgi:hypothetical protein